MYPDTAMKIYKKDDVFIKDLIAGYITESELPVGQGLFAYSNRMCIRPEYQRSFVYNDKQADAVINSILLGYPLNNFYWTENEDGSYGCMDGQQRTISICEFGLGYTSIKNIDWLVDLNKKQPVYIHDLQYKFPALYERFMNYHLDIQVCSHGTKDEFANWFSAINTNGEKLTDQELRNANYTGKWLTSAKHYFSKTRSNASASPAERISEGFVPSSLKAERQDYLELALQWITNSTKNIDICAYMENHYKDNDAKELYDYFCSVIEWVSDLFPEVNPAYTKQKFWGSLYASYKNEEYDPDEMVEIFNTLIENNEELDNVSTRKKFDFCFTRDPKILNHRTFSLNQRNSLYNRQKGICPDCGKHFAIGDMVAHHIIAWYNGGRTDTTNGVMLCHSCHTQRHLEHSIYRE